MLSAGNYWLRSCHDGLGDSLSNYWGSLDSWCSSNWCDWGVNWSNRGLNWSSGSHWNCRCSIAEAGIEAESLGIKCKSCGNAGAHAGSITSELRHSGVEEKLELSHLIVQNCLIICKSLSNRIL